MSDSKDYTIGWICALETEFVAAQEFLDEEHQVPACLAPADDNFYKLGRMGRHNVVIAILPDRECGKSSAAVVANHMRHSFPSVRVGLMVGVGGGAPSRKNDVRLGDIVVSSRQGGKGGVVQYDYGKAVQGCDFTITGHLDQPPASLAKAVLAIKAEYDRKGNRIVLNAKNALNNIDNKDKYRRPSATSDRLYRSSFTHPLDKLGQDCSLVCGDDACNLIARAERKEGSGGLVVHYGLIASADTLVRDAVLRDEWAAKENILCFEMEAAGLMNHFPCIVIRGICDYADSHKNKQWQGYAALGAAAYAKDLISFIHPKQVLNEPPIKELATTLLSGISTSRQEIRRVKKVVENREQEQILQWITETDYTTRFNTCMTNWEPGTGEWFLKSPEFQAWFQGDKRTLFCEGIPGAGKTILASVAIQEIINCARQRNNIGLAYIYCISQQKHQQSSYYFLASLVKQLAQARLHFPQNIKNLHKNHTTAYKTTRPSYNELLIALEQLAVAYSKVFIIIDALDECEAEDGRCHEPLLQELFKLQAKTSTNILATSRRIVTIRNLFQGTCDMLEVKAKNEDMEKYMEHRLSKLALLDVGSDCVLEKEREEYKAKIKAAIIRTSNGMFLLTRLHFESIIDKTTTQHLDQALNNILRGQCLLDQAYAISISRIREQRCGFRHLAERVLTFLCCAGSLMTTTELQYALAIERGQVKLDKGNTERITIISSACVGLVMVDEQTSIICLVHETTRQYLASHMCCIKPRSDSSAAEKDHEICNSGTSYVAMKNAHRIMANICLDYLFLQDFDKQASASQDLFGRYPFCKYAISNWGLHARGAEEEELELRLLGNQAKVYALGQLLLKTMKTPMVQYLDMVRRYQKGERRSYTCMTSIHVTAFLGLTKITAQLLRQGCDVNGFRGNEENEHWPPLCLAANNGHGATVELLLRSGADVNQAYNNLTALSCAAYQGHEAIADMLLRNDADLGSVDPNCYYTPLMSAIDGGQTATCKLLLDQGDGLESRKTQDETCMSGYTESIQVPQADLLCRAVSGNHLAVVKLFVQEGANMDGALVTAATWGRGTICKFLIESGAHVNSVWEGKTPLQAAYQSKHVDADCIARLLLDSGADREPQGHYPDLAGTPLSIAVRRDNVLEVDCHLFRDVNAESWTESPRCPAQASKQNRIQKERRGSAPIRWPRGLAPHKQALEPGIRHKKDTLQPGIRHKKDVLTPSTRLKRDPEYYGPLADCMDGVQYSDNIMRGRAGTRVEWEVEVKPDIETSRENWFKFVNRM